jgi:predicted porin
MTDGFMTGSRVGFRGVEDLGGGFQALFTIENGFNSFSGALAQQGQLFGRQAWIALSQRLSAGTQTLTLGRQYGAAFQILSPYDTLNWGNQPTVVWPITLTGMRFDNSIEYMWQSDSLTAIAQYSVGGQTTGNLDGSTAAIGARYSPGFWSIGSLLQESRDNAGREMKYGAIGAGVTISQVNLHGVYMVSVRDPHFTVGAPGTTTALANTNMVSNSANATTRRDQVIDVGATVTATPYLFVLAGFAYDYVSSASSSGQNGTVKTAYLLLDYLLSKQTDVYAELDYTHLGGYERQDPAAPPGTFGGTSSHTGFGIGVRNRF